MNYERECSFYRRRDVPDLSGCTTCVPNVLVHFLVVAREGVHKTYEEGNIGVA